MSFLDFNLEELPQSTNNFEPLPAGWYTVSINGAEVKETKAGTGQYIAVRYDVTGPTHEGRVVFGNLNIKNPNPVAEEIGRQQLGDLMRAIGLSRVTDTDQLIGGQLAIKLVIREGRDGYEPSNDIRRFKALAGGQPVAPASGAAPQAEPTAKPPWAK